MERAHGWQLDRDRLADLLEQEERRFVDDHPGSQQLFERGEKAMLSGVPMPWMTEWAGPFPVFAASAEGARFNDVDGQRVRRSLPRGHGGDDRSLAGPDGEGRGRPRSPRDHADAADRGCELGGGRARASLRPAALAVRPDRDGRQPFRASAGEGDHRPAEGPGLRLVLPRHGRRDASRSRSRGRPARGRTTSGRRSTCRRPPGRSSGTISPPWSVPSSPATSPACWRSRR